MFSAANKVRLSRLILLFGLAGIIAGQPIGLGAKGGLRLTDDLGGTFGTSESKRYIVGPMVSAKLPLAFRLEFDALYRRVGFRSFLYDDAGGSFAERDRGNSWEFPMIVRRTLWHGIYAGIGYAPRIIHGSTHVDRLAVTSLNPPVFSYSEYIMPRPWGTTHGIVAEGGIEKRAGWLRIAPEIRCIRWNQPALNVQQPHGLFMVSTQNQVDLLLGISFR